MEIMPLKDRPEFVGILAEWHGREWAHLFAGWDAATARAEFDAAVSGDGVPAVFIALDGGRLLGSISLILNDLPNRMHQNPWLAGMLVAPDARGRGVGSRLVRHLLDWADAREKGEIFLFTESAGAFFARFGFVPLEETVQNGHAITVMRRLIA